MITILGKPDQDVEIEADATFQPCQYGVDISRPF